MDLVKVNFNGDNLEVIEDSQQVVLKDICKFIGISTNNQISKIKADKTYQGKYIKVHTEGGLQEVFCIPLSKLNGWLFSINPNKVKPEVKQKLIEYKEECFDVLHKHFMPVDHHITPQVVNGYKSQIVQHNKKIDNLKAERDYYHKAYEKEISKTVLLVAQKMAQEKGVEHTLLLPTPPKQDKDLEYIQKENLKLKRDLVDIHDRYHQMVSILERTSGIDFIRDELKKLTNSFQRIRSCDESGRPLEHKNLNTDTQAGHKYWDNPY